MDKTTRKIINVPEIGDKLTLADVERNVEFKKTKIYGMIEEGSFPPAKKYGNASKWWSTQIEYYLLFQRWNEQEWQEWISKKLNTAYKAA